MITGQGTQRVNGEPIPDSSQSRFDWSSVASSFMPPSPTDIMNKGIIVAVVGFVGLVLIGLVYLLTRRGKGARNA